MFCLYTEVEGDMIESRLYSYFFKNLKFRYSKKATKFEKNLPLFGRLLTVVSKLGRFVAFPKKHSIFFCFSGFCAEQAIDICAC